MEMKVPALGIMPQSIWISKFEVGTVIPLDEVKIRQNELVATIKRRMDNKDDLLIEWTNEYNEINKYLEEETE